MWNMRGLDIDASVPAYDPISIASRPERKKYGLKATATLPSEYSGGAFL